MENKNKEFEKAMDILERKIKELKEKWEGKNEKVQSEQH